MKRPATKHKACILIVDDHPAVREALAMRIDRQDDLCVCGEASDIAEALQQLSRQQPQLAVIDITLKTGNGLELIKRIHEQYPQARMLVWSMHGESLYAERALRAGAHGYINKDQATGQIINAIRHVLAGKVYLSPSMTERMLTRAVGDRQATLERSPVETLSDRELEVLRLIGQGIKTADIAAQLHLSIGTIWTYRDRIRDKLQLRDGTELAHFATQWVLENPA